MKKYLNRFEHKIFTACTIVFITWVLFVLYKTTGPTTNDPWDVLFMISLWAGAVSWLLVMSYNPHGKD